MRKLILIVMVIACFGVTGCARKSSHVQEIAIDKKDAVLAEKQSAVIFIRDSSFFLSPVVEEINNDIQLVGVLPMHSTLLYKTTPGKHRFHVFTVSRNTAQLLETDLLPGKFYYVRIRLVDLSSGAYDYVFDVDPITETQLQELIGKNKWIKPSKTSHEWFFSHKKSMNAKIQYSKEHTEKVVRKALNPEDGIDGFIE